VDVFRNSSISTHQFSRSTSAWLFPANRPLVWCHSLGSHILAFLNSVGLPSRIYKLIIIQVNKLQVMEPSNQVWHHTPATPRGRLSTSQAFWSATLPYDESIYWQTIRNFSAQKVVQITVGVLYHILVNGENLTWKFAYFLFGSTLTNIHENGRRSLSKLLIILIVARPRNSCLTYFN